MAEERLTTDQLAQLPTDQFYQTSKTKATGLTAAEAAQRLQTVGTNTIQQTRAQSQIKVFLKNFTSLMAILLWVSGVIALIAGMPELGIAIFAVNLINGCFSFWQEHAAQKATDSLKKMLPTYTQVLRDGHTQQINATDLVPGDVFLIQAGNSISADARIMTATSLQVDESALTGESVAVDKLPAYAKGDGKFAEQNVVYAGTVAVNGTATAVAIQTGMQTEFGQIATLTEHQQTTVSPLTAELNRLTKQLSLIAIVIGVLFFFAAIFFVHYPVAKSFVFALGMIVAFIPEGLLPTVTLSLAQGVTRMSKKHALVKELSSVETLGETTVICSDKTGTLTQNQMTINHVWLPDQEFTVSGEGYVNNGQIQRNQQPVNLTSQPDLALLIRVAALNNDTKIQAENSNKPKIIGTPTEAAHLVLAQKSELDLDRLQQQYPRLYELPFDADRKRMTTIHEQPHQAGAVVYVKGALSTVLAVSDRILVNGQVRPLTTADQAKIAAANQTYAAQGLRSMAIAYRAFDGQDGLPTKVADCTTANTEQHLIFVGLTVMADPPRPEIYDAVAKCHRANIRIIMVTGDSPLTAKSVAVKIGIDSEQVRVITGAELSKMSEAALQKAVQGEVIFARVAPEQKYRIVKANQRNGEIVASTGEGVRNAGIPREQLFVNSKVAAEIKNYDQAKQSIDETLSKMGLDYLDMMIIHNPQPWNEVNQGNDRHFEGNLETWRAMEDAVKAGKLKTIGVSSFEKADLENLIQNSATKPAVNQIQIHIGDTPLDLIKYSQDNGIVVEAFSPIAHGAAMNDPIIKKMAAKYGVSVPQLCIRFDWQLNVVVLPKTANPDHMAANAEIDFDISDEDMATLAKIDQMNYGAASVYPVFGGKL